MAEELTNKQRRFCEEYNKTKDVFKAIRIAKLKLKLSDPKKYYVYFLCDPILNEVFYVGKGSGNRFKNHGTKSDKTNSVKKHRIKSIKKLGFDIQVVFIKDNMNESDALSLERNLIRNLEGLTNISNGTITKKERAIKRARNALDRMIKPCELLYIPIKTFPDGSTNYDMYNQNRKELEKIIHTETDQYVKLCM